MIKVDFEDKLIAFPKIGAGLAHGDWDVIKNIINEVFPMKEVKVYVL